MIYKQILEIVLLNGQKYKLTHFVTPKEGVDSFNWIFQQHHIEVSKHGHNVIRTIPLAKVDTYSILLYSKPEAGDKTQPYREENDDVERSEREPTGTGSDSADGGAGTAP